MKRKQLKGYLITSLLILGCASVSLALEPPTPEQIRQYQKDGTWEKRQRDAMAIGNHKMDTGLAASADYKLRYLSYLSKGVTPQKIDQILTPPPRWRGMPSTGAVNMFVLLIEFNDYPHISPADDQPNVDTGIFGAENTGSSNYPYESLSAYYDRSSYGLLNLQGATLGWYNPGSNRAAVDKTVAGRETLIKNAINSFDAAGHDFTQYDNDGDGDIDYFAVIWTGPHGEWASFWWGYQTDFSDSTYTIDGKQLGKYSWQWESEDYPSESFSPAVLIHETGHALGLPDYYDYNAYVGPDGGVGGLDMMDANWGDHNAFSKFVLDWLTPTVVANNGAYFGQSLSAAASQADALLIMPGASGSPFGEFFMVQYRNRDRNDTGYPADGLLIWHVNAVLNDSGTDYLYDNSYTDYKLLRLMEADGLEEIEEQSAWANAGDYYTAGESFTPATTPNSNNYYGCLTGVYVTGIAASGSDMVCDMTIDDVTPPDCNLYTMSEPVYAFEDIASTGTSLSMGDETYSRFDIPFTFNFYGNDYTAVSVNSNGTIYFQDAYLGWINTDIPGTNSDSVVEFIALFWDDLNPGNSGDVRWQVLGTAPNRRLIVQWTNVPRYGNYGAATFQAILYEGTNNIRFNYQDVAFGDSLYDYGASASIGIQRDRCCGMKFSYNAATLTNNKSVFFTFPASGLQVTTGPKEAIDAGARWSVDRDESHWYDSGETVPLSAGEHFICFQWLPGWEQPLCQGVVISEGQTFPLEKDYVKRGSRESVWDGNGHVYEAIRMGPKGTGWGGTWEHARDLALAMGGYLVTITSQEEMDFVTNLVVEEWGDDSHVFGPWIGGYQPVNQPDLATGWQWVTGEPWGYTNWDAARGKPDDAGSHFAGEPGSLMMWGPYHSQFTPDPDKWSNLAFVSPYSGQGIVVEYNGPDYIDSDMDGVPNVQDSAPEDPLNTGRIVVLSDGILYKASHGNRWGDRAYFTILAVEFDAGDNAIDRLLHVQSFDVDSRNEIGVYLNEVLLGYLSGGNNVLGPDSLWWLPTSRMVTGINRVEFRQNRAGTKWGVRRLGVFNVDDAFGNLLTAGGDTKHLNGFELHFRGNIRGNIANGLMLEVFGWDNDAGNLVEFNLNGEVLGGLPQEGNGAWSQAYQLVLPKDLLKTGDNTLKVYDTNSDANDEWGVMFGSLRKGNARLGLLHKADQAHANDVVYLIPVSEAGRDMRLTFFDIDFNDEVQILINGDPVGFATLTANNAWGALNPPIELVPGSLNIVELDNTYNPPRNFRWGVWQVTSLLP